MSAIDEADPGRRDVEARREATMVSVDHVYESNGLPRVVRHRR